MVPSGMVRNFATSVTLACLIISLPTLAPINAGQKAFDNPGTKSATGSFVLTTGPGIQPAWASEYITISAIAPASQSYSASAATSTIYLPVVAKTGTANATAGGFKLTNTTTRESVRCLIPTVDTRARVIDCLMDSGYNTAVFAIDSFGDKDYLGNGIFRTSIFSDLKLNVFSKEMAAVLNEALSTNVFTDSVTVANATLTVTRRVSSQS